MTRIQSVDVFRVLAIIAVICLHTNVYSGPHAVGVQMDLATYLVSASRFAVPLFFIVSGYFWADRSATPVDAWNRSLTISKRTAIIFIAWSAVYLLIEGIAAIPTYGVLAPIKLLYWKLTSPSSLLLLFLDGAKVHLWFLPALISTALISGGLVALGLQKLLAPVAIILYVIALAGGPYENSAIGFHSPINLRDGPFFGMLFFVAGAYLHRIKSRANWPILGLGLALSGFALQLAEVACLHRDFGANLSQDYVAATFLFGLGAGLIALSNATFLQMPRLASVGQVVLGIYASHYVFVDLLRPIDDSYHGTGIWDIAYVAIVFILSIATAQAMSKFSLTRRLVR